MTLRRELPEALTERYAKHVSGVLTSEPVPLTAGTDGVIRINGTRVTLDTILAAFAEGATPEEIAQQYPSASLAAVYQSIGYYLRHSAELESYLIERGRNSTETKALNESKWPPAGIRDRLLSRRHA